MVNIHSYSNDSGIYGIYIDDALVYIGKTSSFHYRFNGHMNSLRHDLTAWYPLAREFDARGHRIEAKIIEKTSVRAMSEKEQEYIHKLQPLFNVQGCFVGKLRPDNYDTAVALLGLTPKPPINKPLPPKEEVWFGEKITIRRW